MTFWRRQEESEKRVDAVLRAIEKGGGADSDALAGSSTHPTLPPAREPDAKTSTNGVSTEVGRDESQRPASAGIGSAPILEDHLSDAAAQNQPTGGQDRAWERRAESIEHHDVTGREDVSGSAMGPSAYEQALQVAIAEADVMAERIGQLRQRVAEMEELIREGEADHQKLLDLADLLRQSAERTQPRSTP